MKIAIIDDIAKDRMQVERYIKQFFSQFQYLISPEIVHFESGEEFLDRFKRGEYTLIFIDQYMNGISGMDVVRQIRMNQDEVTLIFVTNSMECAVDGYKMRVSGYLLKPFTYEQFAETLHSIHIKQLQDQQLISIPVSNGEDEKILLRDIMYCDIQKHYCYLHLKTGENKKFRMSFQKLKEILEPYPQFLKCYTGSVVNMYEIKKITSSFIELKDGENVPFPKKEYANIVKNYSDFIFSKRQFQEIVD